YESTNDSDGKPLQLIDRIATDDNEKMMEKLVLKDIISKLTPREQAITYLRYYKDLTQGEIAKRMGVSQVQISRIENKIIQKLKELYEEQ
ncbi:MAG: sigma-70 family RNA polymerase sigma factor, partial [Clostridia bacterium]|nr:sigma-70 family RNA polymerase sigma factor [Clostridia bacterium]